MSNETAVMPEDIDPKAVAEILQSNQESLQRSNELIKILNAKIHSNRPKVEFYDTVTQTKDTKDMAEVAKILRIEGMGRNNLMAVLRDLRILRDNNEPYQSYVDRGYFKLVEVEKCDSYGTTRVYAKTVATQKGIDFIRRMVLEHLGSDE